MKYKVSINYFSHILFGEMGVLNVSISINKLIVDDLVDRSINQIEFCYILYDCKMLLSNHSKFCCSLYVKSINLVLSQLF